MKGVAPIWTGDLPNAKTALHPHDILPRPKKKKVKPVNCRFEGPKPGFLGGCAADQCGVIKDLDIAKKTCNPLFRKKKRCILLSTVEKQKCLFMVRKENE